MASTRARLPGESHVRRNPDLAHPAAVLGPDGRVEPFDGARLAVSLRRALSRTGEERLGAQARHRADDLASVIELFLSRNEQGPLVGRDEVAELARRLLVESGDDVAAQVYEALRQHSRAQGPRARAAAPEVPLTALLTDGAPGSAVDRRLAGALLQDHALRHVLPSDAVAAQEDGWIDFRPWLVGARVVEAVLPAGWSSRQGNGRMPRSAVLGAALRPLAGLVLDDLVLPWEGALPGRRAAQDLAHQLVNTDGSAGRVVLSLPAHRALQADALQVGLLEALETIPLARWALRVHGPCSDPEGLAKLTAGRCSIEAARRSPVPGCVSAAARVHLPVLAAAAGAGRPGAFLDLVAEAVQLTERGLVAWADSEPVRGAWQALGPSLGEGAAERLRIDLAGWAAARRLILGDGVRARANGDDLAAALGERLAREHQGQAERELTLVASADAPDDAVEVARLAELLRLCPGAAVPVPPVAEDFYRALMSRSPSLTGSGSCA